MVSTAVKSPRLVEADSVLPCRMERRPSAARATNIRAMGSHPLPDRVQCANPGRDEATSGLPE